MDKLVKEKLESIRKFYFQSLKAPQKPDKRMSFDDWMDCELKLILAGKRRIHLRNKHFNKKFHIDMKRRKHILSIKRITRVPKETRLQLLGFKI